MGRSDAVDGQATDAHPTFDNNIGDSDDEDEMKEMVADVGIEKEVMALLHSMAAALMREWEAKPQRVVGASISGMVLAMYLRRASIFVIGVFVLIISAIFTVTYLKSRTKQFELIPIVLVDGTKGDVDSSAVHSASRRVSRRWDVCHVCLKQRCSCTKTAQATELVENDVLVSPEINAVLADIFKIIVEQYVLSWYSLYSTDPECVVEIQIMMRHMACAFTKRVHTIDTATLVKTRLLPALINHVEAYLIAEGQQGEGSVHRRALDLYGTRLHAAYNSEERYFREVFMQALSIPGVLDRGKSKCRSLKLFIAQNMTATIKSSIASCTQPRFLNNAIVSALSPATTATPAVSNGNSSGGGKGGHGDGGDEGTSRVVPRKRINSGSSYEALCAFVPQTAPRKSSLDLAPLSVLTDPDLRLQFQVYCTRTGDIDMLMLYRLLDNMLSSVHDMVTQDTLAEFHKFAVTVTTQVAVLPIGPIVAEKYCGTIRRIAETPPTRLTPAMCKKAPFEAMLRDVQHHVTTNIVPAFLRSEEYYEALLLRAGPPLTGRGRANTEKEKPKPSKKKERRREAEIQAEIEKLNLPPPPSAVEEEHPDLVTDASEVKKRKQFFSRKSKTTDRHSRGRSITITDEWAMGGKSASESLSASAAVSREGSPSLVRRLTGGGSATKVESPKKMRSTDVTPAASPGVTRRRTNSQHEANGGPLDPAQLEALAQDMPRRKRPSEGEADSSPEGTPSSQGTTLSQGNSRSSLPDMSQGKGAGAVGAAPGAVKPVQPTAVRPAGQAGSAGKQQKRGPVYNLTGVSTAIKKWEKRHPGSRQFVVYTIQVSQRADFDPQAASGNGGTVLATGNTWEVDRRYSDFAALEKKLKRLYPEFDLATLPDKKRFGNLEQKHLDMRKALLHDYLASLVENPLIHNDKRCTEIVHKFLDRKCNFKEEMKNHVFRGGASRSGITPIGKLLSKKDKDWTSFTSLFTVTLEDVEEQTAAAYNVEVQAWAKIRPELDAARAKPDTPVFNTPRPKVNPDGSVDDPLPEHFNDSTAALDDCSVATRLVRVFGTMCGRLRYGWFPQSALGLFKLLFGGSIDTNLKHACEAAIKLDEPTLLKALEDARESMEQAAATAANEAAALANQEGGSDTGDGATAPKKPETPPPETEDGPSDEALAATMKQLVVESIPPAISQIFGEAEVARLATSVVDVFQDDVYNRQLAYTVIDAIIAAMFPELEGRHPRKGDGR